MRLLRVPYARLAEAGGRDKDSRGLDGIRKWADLTSGGATLPPPVATLGATYSRMNFWPLSVSIPRQTFIRRTDAPTGAPPLAAGCKSVLVNCWLQPYARAKPQRLAWLDWP